MSDEQLDPAAPADLAPRPRGPEDVTAAVVDAATKLLAERGPAAVSLRDIAREARVNYGLIHYYFGTKDDVLRTVFASLSYRAADRLATAAEIGPMMDEYWQDSASANSYVRMLSWLLLDGRDPGHLLGRSPALAQLTAAIQRERHHPAAGGDDQGAPGPAPAAFDPRLVAAATVLMSMGWRLFSSFLIPAAGLEDRSAEDLYQELGELVRVLIAASGGS
jgi:TetR/AcrR family transcriptional regulator, repressor for neighboring sulfatase